jgi:hypothetical protein
VGNICGAGTLLDGGSVDVNASQNCCDGKKAVCNVDSTGVPRCFGGGSIDGGTATCPNGYTGADGCCIGSGGVCQFSDQCCSNALCLPAPDGGAFLTCQSPSCSPVGTRCDQGGVTCCPGTQCLATSELTKACRVPSTGDFPDGGTANPDGGTTTPDGGGGGVCSANGASCSSAAQCCSNICSNGTCQAPQACQPQTGVCTSSSDCCSGLSCDVPLGSTTGTCQPGSVCSVSGQSCSPTQGCCTGLSCRSTAGTVCDGTTSCVCQVIIR